MNDQKDRMTGLRQVSLLTAIPALLVIGPLIGLWLGRYLDQRFGTEPYLLVVFVVLGFVASGRETWKLIKLASDTEAHNKK